MIQANELRIGNVVDTFYFPKRVIITGIKDGFVSANFSDKVIKSISLGSIRPIQLTEEILLKFDFDKIENGKYLNKFYVTIVSGYCVFWITDTYSVAIKYAHELQNLYFALTGEELEIKL